MLLRKETLKQIFWPAHPAFSDVIEVVAADHIGAGAIGVSEGVGAHRVATQPGHGTLHHHIVIDLRVDVTSLRQSRRC